MYSLHTFGLSPVGKSAYEDAPACEQDPDSRPGADVLQRHEFVAGSHVNAASALLPLIQRSRSLVATLYAESDGPPKLPTGVE